MTATIRGVTVARRLLPPNAIDQVQWSAPEVAQAVDRRMVAPDQVWALLDAVREAGRRGDHLVPASAAPRSVQRGG